MATRLLILALVLLGFSPVKAAGTDNGLFDIEQLDNRSGLSNSAINNIYIDKDGFLWVGTWDGLNYYDGYTFQHINYASPESKSGISNNVIQHIQEDNNNNIWVTTIGGISKWDKRSGFISNYFYNTVPNESIGEHEYGIAVDYAANNIYAYTPKMGLVLYNATTQIFSRIRLSINYGRLTKILIDQDNLYLLNTEDVFYGFKISGDQFKKITAIPNVSNCFIANHRLLLAQKDKSLSVYNNSILIKKIVLHDDINAIGFYNNHYLVALREKGFKVYDSACMPSDYMNEISNAYNEIKITSFGNNASGSLWLGTDGNGILKLTPKTNVFGTINFSKLNMPYNVPIRAFSGYGNDLWLGTKGRGIVVLKNFNNPETSMLRPHLQLSYPGQLDNNSVYVIKNDISKYIYIGSDAEGIGLFNKENNRFYKWADISKNTKSPKFGSVYSIYEDADSSLWLGTSGYGLIHLKLAEQNNNINIKYCEKYTVTGNDKGPINNIIYSIVPASGNNLWIGCRYGGLNLFDTKTKTFRELKGSTQGSTLSNNDILCLFKDSRGQLWVGTSYGLNLLTNTKSLDEQTSILQFTNENGLPNNTIHGITEDLKGNIWVSTNKGIAKILWPEKKIINYQESDGLQSSEFSDGAIWTGFGNKLFFGGIAGFNAFDPALLKDETGLPNMLLSNIIIGGRPVGENKLPVILPDSYPGFNLFNSTVERKNNYFELNIKPLNYHNADKCELSYFLEGYDKAWHTAKGIIKIAYGNLPVGSYTLKIKWSNGAGEWSAEKEALSIKVKQYAWLSLPALIGYAILVLAIAFVIFKYRRDSIKEKHKLETEKLLRVKEDEIHQNRISFFTNIAHELQTPLTLVMGSFDRILEKSIVTSGVETDKNRYYAGLIQQQTAKLTYLLQQLFEFRKIETPYYQSHFDFIDITSLLKNLAEPFIALSEQARLDYQYHIQESISGGIDKDKVEKTVYNLLSNAFKYTPAGGEIKLDATTKDETLHIAVYNSGISLTDEQVAKLFDLFYTDDSKATGMNQFGTGIGLTFAKQLTGLMGGKINVVNNEAGVCFEVSLPIKEQNTENTEIKNLQPSYLYNILTQHGLQFNYKTTAAVNKNTIINTIVETDKEAIVIVEDEKEIRFLLGDILKDTYHIYEAENGAEALNLIHQYNPVLVISDVVMANMNGLELCDIIKNTNSICHIPVILLSARNSEEQRMEGYDAGADAYISKPFNAVHLALRIKKLIEYRKRMQTVLQENTTIANISFPEIKKEDEDFLNRIYKIIEDNIINPELNALFLEKELCVSHMQLYRKLKGLSGMTPGEFIKNVRLTSAAKLLHTTKQSVADIFFQTGFNNQSYFFREFKKKYNIPPNEYRAQYARKTP